MNDETQAQASRQEEPALAMSSEDASILPGYPVVGTVEDVASTLQLKPNAVRKLCRQGDIKAVKCGNLWRIPRARLVEFIEKGGNL